MSSSKLLSGIFTENFDFELKTNRKYYLYVVSGDVNINNHSLIEGDGLSFIDENKIEITTKKESEIILFELN
jgi:redox-sensitive bicupin YhaK (pirin superfamily)